MTDRENKSPANRLIRLDEVLAHLPISRSTFWEGVRAGRYPRPVKLGERITCWRLPDILRLAEHGVDPASEGESRPKRFIFLISWTNGDLEESEF